MSETFKDAKDREWKIPSFNLANLKAIQDTTGIFLPHLLSGENNASKDALSADYLKMLDVIIVVCQPEFTERGLSVEAFMEGLDGDAIQRAESAITRAVIDFFPSQKRALLTTAMMKSQELSQTVTDLMTQVVSGDLFTEQLEDSVMATGGSSSVAES